MTETQMRICPDVPDLTPEEWERRELERVNRLGERFGGVYLTRLTYAPPPGKPKPRPEPMPRKKCQQPKRRRPVRCVETGEVYPSVGFAADQVKESPANLVRACKYPARTCGGFHWEYVKPAPASAGATEEKEMK